MAMRRRGGRRGPGGVVADAGASFLADRCPQLAAALAYSVLFAVAPLLVLATAVAGLLYGSAAAKGRVVAQASRSFGAPAASLLAAVLTSAQAAAAGLAVAGAVLLVAASVAAFASAKDALDRVWGVEPRPGRGIAGIVRDSVPPFLLLLVAGAILVVSFMAHVAVQGVAAMGAGSRSASIIVPIGDVVATVLLAAALFALIFRYLGDARIPWRDVLTGSAVTAGLFVAGQWLIGLYLTHVAVGSAYGAAGSLVALLVWLDASALVFLFGAEVTKTVAVRRGARIEPKSQARRIEGPCPHGGEGGRPPEPRRQ